MGGGFTPHSPVTMARGWDCDWGWIHAPLTGDDRPGVGLGWGGSFTPHSPVMIACGWWAAIGGSPCPGVLAAVPGGGAPAGVRVVGLTRRLRMRRSDIWRRCVTGGMRASVAGRRDTSCFMSLSSSSSWLSTATRRLNDGGSMTAAQ